MAAIGGSCLFDQLWFHLGRRFRQAPIVRSVARRAAFARALERIERHPIRFILLFRFAYGLRAVAPVAIGASRVPAALFVPLNLIAACVWGALFTGLGYAFGPTVEALEARYGTGILVAIVALSVLTLGLAARRGKA